MKTVNLWLLLVMVLLCAPAAFAQVDFSGEWSVRNHEDPGQPPLGDYLGIPFNQAGRVRAETTAESIWGTPEYQCRPHSAPHVWRGVGGARIIKEVDPFTRGITAYHVQHWRSLDRVIYMDGRPHPPAWAPHTWSGFSTGKWVGNTLVVTTTHLKDGYLKRSGPQTSDMYTMTEYISRYGNYLNVFMIVDDPIYLDEPFIQSTTSELNPGLHVPLEPCTSSFDENGGNDPHFVPHYLPGQNSFLTEWLENENWIPKEAARGGANTIYPPYTVGSTALSAPLSKSAVVPRDRIFAQSPRDGQVHVLPVQRNVYMMIADGNNIAVSVGPEGALMVDTGAANMSDKVLAALQELTKSVVAAPKVNTCLGVTCAGGLTGWSSVNIDSVIGSPAPARALRFIFNTSASPDRTGGNQKLGAAGFNPRGGADDAMRIAHENVMVRMSSGTGDKALPPAALPTDTYHRSFYKLSEYFNGEPVVAYHVPAAHSDGDSLVYFRHSEVIATGNVFSTVTYPIFDLQKGGSIQGVIDALSTILDLGVAESRSQGGTYVIPGRGRLSDMADVATYRNMVVMIRDRVKDAIKKNMTLEQVKRAQLTIDFDGRYGLDPTWTPDMFIEAVYQSLKKS